MTEQSPQRVVIRGVEPEIEGGRFPVKRVIGETVVVQADIFADGHDSLGTVVRYRHEDDQAWSEISMAPLGNDRWQAEFPVEILGIYIYTITAWVDPIQTWYKDFLKQGEAGQNESTDLQTGVALLDKAAERAFGSDAQELRRRASALRAEDVNEQLATLASRYADRTDAAHYKELRVTVDPVKARFSTWYEMLPRSFGTFKDCAAVLPEVAGMGFDVLYFRTIGSTAGGHKSVHPDLGTLDDFRHLVDSATRSGIDIALDLAYQCSPEHPYIKEHPEWFRHRPDGSILFDFESPYWRSIWTELKSIVEFWIDQGVRIFGVDEPHTKPFDFWEWMIRDLKKKNPDLIFLCETFTRPNIMYRLAKLGFTQSYTYFTWRNTKKELIEYLTELTQIEVREFLRPNLWPNTPDIFPEYLQRGGRSAFLARFVLAATLGSNCGIYRPARNPDDAGSLEPFISRVNAIRKENRALQSNENLRFHSIDNEQLIAYSKQTADRNNVILTVVNLDPFWKQSGFLELPLEDLGIDQRRPYRMVDLISGASFMWQGPRNYIELRPGEVPAHILRKE